MNEIHHKNQTMTEKRGPLTRFIVLCVGQVGTAVAPVLRNALGDMVAVELVDNMQVGAWRIQALNSEQAAVPLIVGYAAIMEQPPLTIAADSLGSDSLAALDNVGTAHRQAPPRLLAIGSDEMPSAADGLVKHQENHAELLRLARELITDYIVHHAPEALTKMCSVLDSRVLADALVESQRANDELGGRLRLLRHSITSASRLSDEAAEARMLDLLQQVLVDPTIQQLPADTVLLTEDETIDGIWVILDGQIELSRRHGDKNIVFHSKSVGRIVGLLALAGRQKTFFTARSITSVRTIFLSWQELDEALQREPALLLYFMIVHVRSLVKRLRRIVELQLQIEDLNLALASQRDNLADALKQLEDAQARLIEQEKMVILGQLVAGVGHELNNPATAIIRATDYVVEDALPFIGAQVDGPMLVKSVQTAMNSTPLPTAELRQCRQALEKSIGDQELVRRLLKVGITTLDAYKQTIGNLPASRRDLRLATLERAWQFGTSLRNIRISGERISAIVKSLRSYARPQEELAEIDLNEGLEDTLLLFHDRLKQVNVHRQFGQLPKIRGWAAQLNQVWSNLIANAIDAMPQPGELTIQTMVLEDDQPENTQHNQPADHQRVMVRITDNGAGITSENLSRVFDLNFTTKRAGAGFGLGMGLVICQQIVHRHRGSIHIESQPGQTTVQVILPADPVNADETASPDSTLNSVDLSGQVGSSDEGRPSNRRTES